MIERIHREQSTKVVKVYSQSQKTRLSKPVGLITVVLTHAANVVQDNDTGLAGLSLGGTAK